LEVKLQAIELYSSAKQLTCQTVELEVPTATGSTGFRDSPSNSHSSANGNNALGSSQFIKNTQGLVFEWIFFEPKSGIQI